MVVCVCVWVLRVLQRWGGDIVRCGTRVFFCKVGLDCGDYGVWVCRDFVCYGVSDFLEVGLISSSGL